MKTKIELIKVGDEFAIKKTEKLLITSFVKFADFISIGYFWSADISSDYYNRFWTKDEKLANELYEKFKVTHEG